jgi:valyl-tRNA synthetase
MNEMEKTYDPSSFEKRIYKDWEEAGAFQPDEEKSESFSIVIPPPNVTGVLHMGHGLNNSLQDILIRYKRMKGYSTLWLPGTDHAGIATQNVVERRLKAKGTNRHQLGRDKFLEETWKVKNEHHKIITQQLKEIGASCDWSRERFTLDEGLSKAVREVFVELYNKDLIYRGEYLVNWCPSCTTALADDEVEHEEKNGHLWRFSYPLEEGGSIEIETTRPETMLGDTAVAVHPEDERYKHLIGSHVILPLVHRKIPIIADHYVDREFGSGAVKITPAHDPNDWEIGNRHNLERINILNPDGTLNDQVPEQFRGLPVMEARKAVLEALDAEGLLIEDKKHKNKVGHCYRCNEIIQPFMSEQWFVRMKDMADRALKAWEDEEIKFYPAKWGNTYKNWLSNIRDWCISRQLWWGHRIPVWYCNDCGEQIVSKVDPEACSCGGSLRQEEDVLDTWFSSWLWPFSTMGWPENTSDLEKFFPTNTLVTGYDIIFFWVARMIMASQTFTGRVPFKDIYITGLVRDKQGRKMSKSLGNGIDPLEIVAQYGSDAMRFTLCYLAAQGQDVLIDKESFKFGSKFANKIWNASRYILMNLEAVTIRKVSSDEYTLEDRWIYNQLARAAEKLEKALKQYRFNDAGNAVYDFFWNDLCDWYLEASKMNLYSKDASVKERAAGILVDLLAQSLKLLHPFMPYITEEIYSKLPLKKNSLLISEAYPECNEDQLDSEAEEVFETLKEAVRTIRTIRSEFTISPEKRFKAVITWDKPGAQTKEIEEKSGLIANFAKVDISFETSVPSKENTLIEAGSSFEVYLYLKDLIDIPKKLAKLTKEEKELQKLIKSTNGKLKNERFIANAPKDVIEKEHSKLEEFETRVRKIQSYMKELS